MKPLGYVYISFVTTKASCSNMFIRKLWIWHFVVLMTLRDNGSHKKISTLCSYVEE